MAKGKEADETSEDHGQQAASSGTVVVDAATMMEFGAMREQIKALAAAQAAKPASAGPSVIPAQPAKPGYFVFRDASKLVSVPDGLGGILTIRPHDKPVLYIADPVRAQAMRLSIFRHARGVGSFPSGDICEIREADARPYLKPEPGSREASDLKEISKHHRDGKFTLRDASMERVFKFLAPKAITGAVEE